MIDYIVQPIYIGSILSDGGVTFTYPTLLMAVICVGLTVYGFAKNEREHAIKLLSTVSIIALVWGFLGQTFGLIGGLDRIESLDNVAPNILAGGLKTTLISGLLGMFAFLIGRAGILLLQIKK